MLGGGECPGVWHGEHGIIKKITNTSLSEWNSGWQYLRDGVVYGTKVRYDKEGNLESIIDWNKREDEIDEFTRVG